MPSKKKIVTNSSAFVSKYGNDGYSKIKEAVKLMISSDEGRGLQTTLIEMDSKTDMAPYGEPVKSKNDPRAIKKAIDGIYAKEKPDYIVILGATDVVPLVQLKNPVYSPDSDPDKTVPSDLPYACDSAYSTDINSFVGPTRVIGRLPDLVAASSPQYLVNLIKAAANYKTLTAADYRQYFGLSAQVWQNSTALSLTKVFGAATAMHTSPPSGPAWTEAQLAPLSHFVNCHGAQFSPDYYGQPEGQQKYPVALSAKLLSKKIKQGAILAAECCYGAEMYDPEKTGGQAGVAYTYLREGAYGVFGSTTIAYGPSSGNGSADLICQYFMQAVIGGASLGRATLEARHKFVEQYSHLDPVDLKTLGQYYLLGDPSIHAAAIAPHGLNTTKTFRALFTQTGDSGTRSLRRDRLHRTGATLKKDFPKTVPAESGTAASPPREVTKVLSDAARESGLKKHTTTHFQVDRKGRGAEAMQAKRSVHLLMGVKERGTTTDSAEIPSIVAIVATVEDGKVLHLRRLHSR